MFDALCFLCIMLAVGVINKQHNNNNNNNQTYTFWFYNCANPFKTAPSLFSRTFVGS